MVYLSLTLMYDVALNILIAPLLAGQKGIGFKSVFKVTDYPEIHSNGFHLCFNKNSGPMGYILPHWTEDQRPLGPELNDINQRRLDQFQNFTLKFQ